MAFGLGVLVGVLVGSFAMLLICSAIAVTKYQDRDGR
jgi:hypothetical protein